MRKEFDDSYEYLTSLPDRFDKRIELYDSVLMDKLQARDRHLLSIVDNRLTFTSDLLIDLKRHNDMQCDKLEQRFAAIFEPRPVDEIALDARVEEQIAGPTVLP